MQAAGVAVGAQGPVMAWGVGDDCVAGRIR